MSVIGFSKRITLGVEAERPAEANAGSRSPFAVRAGRLPDDLDGWLQLQNAAFPRPRPWTERDFRRELAGRPDWDAERLLVVERRGRDGQLAGSVYLELPAALPVVRLQWLAVHPSQRLQGVGRLLIDAACALGARERRDWLVAETLRSWSAAVGFYTALGFLAGRPGEIPSRD